MRREHSGSGLFTLFLLLIASSRSICVLLIVSCSLTDWNELFRYEWEREYCSLCI